MNKFRELIELRENLPTVSDGAGGFTASEKSKGQFFANITPRTSRTVTEAGKIIFANYYKVLIRYIENFAPQVGDIVIYNGRRFTIKDAKPLDMWSRNIEFSMVELTTGEYGI